MSYLSPSRIHFTGRFQADTSTVNNSLANFNSATFQPDYDNPHIGVWNPYGTGAWRFRDCVVTAVGYQDGTVVTDAVVDPVVGMGLLDAGAGVSAKLVDLDPQQQMVSQIWGFALRLASPQLGTAFRGDFEVAAFADIWKRVADCPSFDRGASAYWQSVLSGVTWPNHLDSRVLDEIRAQGSDPSRLSVRFTTDGFDNLPDSPDFTWGRVVGAIGPCRDDEPRRFVAGRLLRARRGQPLQHAPANLVGNLLLVDLANSFPMADSGGSPVPLGELQLAILDGDAPAELLGPIPYQADRWQEERAGIHSVTLTDAQQELALDHPLAVVGPGSDGPSTILLAEHPSGALLRADDYVFRMSPGDTATATLYARRFGKPAAAKVQLAFDNRTAAMQSPPGASVGIPATALTFPEAVTIDESGRATVSLLASDPGNPRHFIDGQVYGVGYQWEGMPGAAYSDGSASGVLNALVWSQFTWSGEPTWRDHVQPIFQQYANLYPAMKPILDLSDFLAVRRSRRLLAMAFGLPVTDANSMPVVRDLSPAKRSMIQQWLEQPWYFRITTVDELHQALQQAIALELSTLAPYLCALYSIKPDHNREVARIIRSVLVEEMLHLTLACNLLNAVGGTPVLDHPEVVPRYPTGLPGGLRPELTVTLRRCSLAQIRDCFMGIEEPEEVLANPADASGVVHHPLTIGWFYQQIEEAMGELDVAGTLFTGEAARQVSRWPSAGSLVVVKDLTSAREAIAEIIEQGEGTSAFNPDTATGELSHYHRFEEIVQGRRLVVDADRRGYRFSGDPIAFDPDGVWPMMDDPDIGRLPAGSRAHALAVECNRRYAQLLTALTRVFNGHPDGLDSAIGLMYSMGVVARQLVQTPSGRDDGTTAGPTFQPFASS